MYYNEDGSIQKVPYWLDNELKQVEAFDPYRKVEAETMAWGYGLKTRETGKSIYINNIDEGEYLMLRGVDFKNGARRLKVSASNEKGSPAYIEVRIDSADGPVCGSVKIDPTNGFKTFTCPLKGISGIHDLYFVFKGEAGENLFEWDWWQMSR